MMKNPHHLWYRVAIADGWHVPLIIFRDFGAPSRGWLVMEGAMEPCLYDLGIKLKRRVPV